MQKVTIYSTQTCSYCKMAKQFFKDNKIEYTNFDVGEDEKASEEMVKKTEQMSVPVIIIEKDGKEDVIIGFDEDKLKEILGVN